MFETLVAKIIDTLRNAMKAVAAATRKTPWLAPIVILAFFLVL